VVSAVLFWQLLAPAVAFAFSSELPAEVVQQSNSRPDVNLSRDGDAASTDATDFAIDSFVRSNKGTARDYQGVSYGYRYPQVSNQAFVALALQDAILVYVPADVAAAIDFDLTYEPQQQAFVAMLTALDSANSNGGEELANLGLPYIFTSDISYTSGDFEFTFDFELEQGYFYTSITLVQTNQNAQTTQSAQTTPSTNNNLDISKAVRFCDSGNLRPVTDVAITAAPQGLDALTEFLTGIDYRPFWVSMRTSLVAIVIVFVLGLLAARFSLNMNRRSQAILDAIFTIPMVLPPTVCGFLLLVLFGNSTELGRWLIAHGVELIFTWQAAVMAAVVVSFPLMYRTVRGAFEAQDAEMLDAARTLGWRESRIFFKLMLPLAWPSIAAGTVLAFARAMGEFGATLFVAGNYAGETQTMPIAIYFQWMGGNTAVATFWVFVVVLISFVVILFINIYSSHTQRYRLSTSDAKVLKDDSALPKHQISEEL
jgi:molybdate transport system permease protein